MATRYCCDQCGKESPDGYFEVELRYPKRMAQMHYLHFDFCSETCAAAWLLQQACDKEAPTPIMAEPRRKKRGWISF